MDNVPKTKRPSNPWRAANIFSRITLSSTFPIFRKGYNNNLEEGDIPALLDEYTATTVGDKLESCWKMEKTSNSPSLLRAIFRVFGTKFMLMGLCQLFDRICMRLLRSLAIVLVVRLFSNYRSQINMNEVYMYSGVIVATSLFSVLISQFTDLQLELLTMKIRTACATLVYRKSLKLSISSLRSVTIGHITNILANDLERVEDCVLSSHFLTILILYYLVGPSSTIGILPMVLLVPLQVYFGKKCTTIRLNIAAKTDERLRLISEIVTGIKAIKMYVWEKPFEKLVGSIRRLETKEIRLINYVRGFMKFMIVTPKIAIFLAIVVFVLGGNNITPVYAYAVASFYDNLKISLTIHFNIGISSLSEFLTSMKRIQELLLRDEVASTKSEDRKSISESPATDNISKINTPMVKLLNVSAKWSDESPEFSLNKVTLSADVNQLIGIVGHVGSGKSTIIHAILNELTLASGSIYVQGKVSYASQELWIFTGNIQQNILFGQPMVVQRYNEVLSVCALEQDLRILPFGDKTLVGERGVVLSGGQNARINLARAVYANVDIYLLDEPFSAVDTHVAKHIFEQCVKRFLMHKCIILITYQNQYLSNCNYIYVVDEGKVTVSGTYAELKEHTSMFANHSLNTDNATPLVGDIQCTIEKEMIHKGLIPCANKEYRNTGKISLLTFVSYFKEGGSLLMWLTIITYIVSQIAFTASDYFIAFWVNEEDRKLDGHDDMELSEASYVYTALILIMVFTTMFRVYVFFQLCSQISITLHESMFKSTVRTSMRFFHTNHSGRILNRFSRDMGVIDEAIPTIVAECSQIFLTIIGIFIVIAIANLWLLINTVIAVMLFYLLRRVYLKTSREIIRLEGTARSPVFGQVSKTLQGLTTIRAANSQLQLNKEFEVHQDLQNSMMYSYITCSRAFNLYSELVCVVYLTVIIICMIFSQSEQNSGNIGLAITQGISLLVMLQWAMFQSSVLENKMTSVERVLEYAQLKLEESSNSILPSHVWPESGSIRFISLSLRYSPEELYVLKNINFHIESKQKIGIVGRTGAGKSSLITALFQLTKTEGTILIDNLDITKIPFQTVRSKISIIPQDPVLFSGTLRSNLDPFSYHTDSDLWSTLEDIELKAVVSGLPLGLDYPVGDGGSNFSVGQRQLICLGRAINKKNKILVLDEATANVDPETDVLIQKTIRRKFSNCTVLTIAHRLNTIMDSDKILVMDCGQIVEFDHPHLLLQHHKGIFHSMLQQTGPSIAALLSKIAQENYNKGP